MMAMQDLKKHYNTIARIYDWLEKGKPPANPELIQDVKEFVAEAAWNGHFFSAMKQRLDLPAPTKLYTDTIYFGDFYRVPRIHLVGMGVHFTHFDIAIFDGTGVYPVIDMMQGNDVLPLIASQKDGVFFEICDFSDLLMAIDEYEYKQECANGAGKQENLLNIHWTSPVTKIVKFDFDPTMTAMANLVQNCMPANHLTAPTPTYFSPAYTSRLDL